MTTTAHDERPPGEPESEDEENSWTRTVAIVWIVMAAVFIIGRFSPYEPVRDFFNSFSWLTEHTLEFVKDMFESYGYLTVFLAPLLENTIFLGALIPGTLVIMLAGLAAHDGLISFWPAAVLGAIGAMIGDTISYGIGRFGWQRLGPNARLVKMSERMREPLLNNSIWLVLSYHFAGYSRLIGPATAGFIRMPFFRWMLLDYVGVTLWVLVFLTVGWVLGVFSLSLDDTDSNVRIFEVFLFVLFLVSIFALFRRTEGTKQPEGQEEERVEAGS